MTEQGREDCCAPGRVATAPSRAAELPPELAAAGAAELIALDGGWFQMGSEDTYAYEEDGEGPVRSVRVAPFQIAAHVGSNRQFAEFVDATGYVTSAEHYAASFVFGGLLPDDFPPPRAVAAAPWWREVPGACWRHPEGGHSTVDARADHPRTDASGRRSLPDTRLPLGPPVDRRPCPRALRRRPLVLN